MYSLKCLSLEGLRNDNSVIEQQHVVTHHEIVLELKVQSNFRRYELFFAATLLCNTSKLGNTQHPVLGPFYTLSISEEWQVKMSARLLPQSSPLPLVEGRVLTPILGHMIMHQQYTNVCPEHGRQCS